MAQLGGRRAFEFTDIPGSARLAALGGVNVSRADRDINFFLSNPALAGDTLTGFASASHQFYPGGIGLSTAAYAHRFNRIGTLLLGIQHINYGAIDSYDASGAALGQVQAGETAIVVGRQHQIGAFRLGVNVKAVFSNLAGYRASALLADIGGLYQHPQHDLTVGLLIRQAGVVLSEFSSTSRSTVPFDVQVGTSYKPAHMPIRFSLTAYHLAHDQVVYDDASTGGDSPRGAARVMRRLNFGAEVLLSRNVNVLAGYNVLQHQELKLNNGGAGAGISLGFSARMKSFEFVFSRRGYVAGKAAYTCTLVANLNTLIKRH